ncbi:MAG: IS3 family transposase [Nodosilinea sp.]
MRQQGELVNHKRVARIMRQMGIQAIYPKPRTTIAGMLAGIPTC